MFGLAVVGVCLSAAWLATAFIWLHPRPSIMQGKYWGWLLPLMFFTLFAIAHIFWLHHPLSTFREFVYTQGAYEAMVGKVPFRDFFFRHGILFPYFNGLIEHTFGWIALKAVYLGMGMLGWEFLRRYLVKHEPGTNANLVLLFNYAMPVTIASALLGQNEFLMLPFIYGALLLSNRHWWLRGILLGLSFCIGTVVIFGVFVGMFCLLRSWKELWRTGMALLLTVLLCNAPAMIRGGYPTVLLTQWTDLILGTFSTVWGVVYYWGGAFPDWLPIAAQILMSLFFFLLSRFFPPRYFPAFLTTVFVGFASFQTQLHVDHCLLVIPLAIAWFAGSNKIWERLLVGGWLLALLWQIIQSLFGAKGDIASLSPLGTVFPGVAYPVAWTIILVMQLGAVIAGILRTWLDNRPQPVGG
jgi:hypothetical protein